MNTTQAPCIVSADPQVPGWDYGTLVFTPDANDVELLASRQRNRDTLTLPQEGDWVAFADGVTRRISYVWFGDGMVSHGGVQTSDGGSWHIHKGGTASFSGGLYSPVAPSSLSDTGTTRPARFWFFHHDRAQAHHAVHVDVNVRVWQCSMAAPK